MFADNQRISHRQLFRQLVLGQLGIYLVTTPCSPHDLGGRGRGSLLPSFDGGSLLCSQHIFYPHEALLFMS